MTMPMLRRVVALSVALSLGLTTLPLRAQPGGSGLISTEQVAALQAPSAAQVAQAAADRARLLATLDRAELAAQLRERGVSPEALRQRVASLTDAEAAALMAQIDQAPAGADVLGLLFTVFIVLLVTDILGLTKVFPFTRPIR